MSKPRRRSKFESTIEKQLPKGTQYEPDRFQYNLECWYKPDWKLPNGIYLETKGRFTSRERTKHKKVRELNPTLDVRFVFMRDQTLSKKSETTYTDWCQKNGFLCAVGVVPKTWLTKQK
jgi:hypothetical protein